MSNSATPKRRHLRILVATTIAALAFTTTAAAQTPTAQAAPSVAADSDHRPTTKKPQAMFHEWVQVWNGDVAKAQASSPLTSACTSPCSTAATAAPSAASTAC